MLSEHGAVVIDADALAREVVRTDKPGFGAVVERFGAAVVGADGELDRAKLADLVFAGAAARDALNAIVHPLVAQRSAELIAAVPAGAIVVYDVPLLAENDLAGDFDVVVVVEADIVARLSRLGERGMSADKARARIAVQAGDDQRRAIAHEVLRNDGDRNALRAQVDELWGRLRARAEGG